MEIRPQKNALALCFAARAPLKSKLPPVLAQAAQAATRPIQLTPAPPFRLLRLANRFWLLPSNASGHRGKAKMAHLVTLHVLLAQPPHAGWCERPPAL